MSYQEIAVSTLTPKLGAEVTGADLANLSDKQIEEIKAAFREHLVLVFRDQTLTRDEQKAFGRLFGEFLDFVGNDRKTFASFAGACRFDGCIEC